MTIGEGIAKGRHNYLERMENARQADEKIKASNYATDQRTFAALANAPRVKLDNSSEELALKERELDLREKELEAKHSWDDAINQQRVDTMKAQQDEYIARMEHYQALEEQTRQYAADLKEERHNADRDMCMLAYNNGGMITSPQVLEDFKGRFKANDLVSIANAGFFYNADGTVKIKKEYTDKNGVKHPVNDDGKDAFFGYSFTYVDPQTGKVALDPQTGNVREMVHVPQGQRQWIESFNSGSSGSRSGGYSGMTFDQRKELEQLKSGGYATKNRMTFLEKFMNSAAGMQMAQNIKTPKDLADFYKNFEKEFDDGVPNNNTNSGNPILTRGGDIVQDAIGADNKGKPSARTKVVKAQDTPLGPQKKATQEGNANTIPQNEEGNDKNRGKTESSDEFTTKLTPEEEVEFQKWKEQYAPNDSGEDYDFRGAFKEGLVPDKNGHWSDKYKKPNHPTFSVESKYATGKYKEKAGKWNEDEFVKPGESYIPKFLQADFKKQYPNATAEDIKSGKYDRVVANMAKRKKNSAESDAAHERIDAKEKESREENEKSFNAGSSRLEAEYNSELEDLKTKIEHEADERGLGDDWIEKEFASQKKRVDAIFNNRRMKYVQKYGAY